MGIVNSSGFNEENKNFPKRIALIGGGRWARVLTDVLSDLVPPSVEIIIHSIHNSKFISSWVSQIDAGKRIQVTSDWPKLEKGHSTVVIIANAAKDHAKAIKFVLMAEVSILVEKPLTLSSTTSEQLINVARSKGIRLAASHVFLYARYIENFAKLISKEKNIQSLNFVWRDSKAETRYGELKKYDPFLPVYADCLPHVLSILDALFPDRLQSCTNLELVRGGAELKLEILLGDIPCTIHLERNGKDRRRNIEVVTKEDRFQLDFSQEPGFIFANSKKVSGDSQWETAKRPLACMLTSFLNWAGGGEFDKRLSAELGLSINRTIDQVSDFYRSAMADWFKYKLTDSSYSVDEDVVYALAETLQVEEVYLTEPIIKKILDQVKDRFLKLNEITYLQILACMKETLTQI
ncbi:MULTISPECIES: Gfo/Idh/MocA family oxidoreductase [Leptospira]|uniref:Oxidoreductase n=1 Tax=Leptospira interrogans serovar Bataviae TaxID=312175 RepID=A0AAP9WK08_LEPIR|nr:MULTISPECIES: Gfo/Idh/MocA family oxidoreductase [Leptospira]EKP04888.1 oxidoreductase, NAD-binding domain protein [Leptospira kirschneri str. 2008720114]MCR8647610.1 oxidoreductase [Leptospira interrogans serovar Bataviae]OAM73268.1 oxidoreductase [Leptospira interrogans serovar Bataviae]QOI38196.1 oxidoreductase [Leptospira interrogans serovar Bataviae]QOI50328.1 oxidoreductase [Leptospira interrogans serovar Bataviae]